MNVTSLITHFLAYAAGMATVWLMCIVIAGGQADDRADEMAERFQPDPDRTPQPGDTTVPMRLRTAAPEVSDEERERIASDVIRSLRRRALEAPPNDPPRY